MNAKPHPTLTTIHLCIISCLLIVFSTGCADDNSNVPDVPQSECGMLLEAQCSEQGAMTCSEGMLQQCVLDDEGCLVWSEQSQCSSGRCQNSKLCEDDSNETCLMTSPSCEEGTLYYCDKKGDELSTTCPLGCADDGASCALCASETYCSDERLYACTAERSDYEPAGDCALGCDGDSCRSCAGNQKCEEGELYRCQADGLNYEETSHQNCPLGCADDGASCATCLTETVCEDNTLYRCGADGLGYEMVSTCPLGCHEDGLQCQSCEGSTQCIHGDVHECRADGLDYETEAAQTCEIGCHEGACERCEPEQNTCRWERLHACRDDGLGFEEHSHTFCPLGCNYERDGCRTCTPGNTVCAQNRQWACRADGLDYEHQFDCLVGCGPAAGGHKCVPCDGEVRCVDGAFYGCGVNGVSSGAEPIETCASNLCRDEHRCEYPTLHENWSIQLPASYGIEDVVVGENGRVYVAYENEVSKFSSSGTQIWTQSFLYSVKRLGVFENIVYVNTDSFVHAVNIEDGNILWSSDGLASIGHYPSAIGTDGVLYKADYIDLVAYDSNGVKQWRTSVDRKPGRPVLKNTTLFMPEANGITARSTADGQVLWNADIGDMNGIAIASDDTIYTIDKMPLRLVAYDSDGIEKWDYALDDNHLWGPTVGPQDEVYVVLAERLLVISATGELLWEQAKDDKNFIGSALVASDGRVYVPGRQGVYAIKEDVGIEYLYRGEVNNRLITTMVMASNGRLYVGYFDGTFVSLDTIGNRGPANSTWPQPGQNPQRTHRVP